MRNNLLIKLGSTLFSVLLLVGCFSTPTHTNTLIFGTNTKVALDVSQDPTGSLGVTLGYKRQEAVWMPLLANKGTSRKLVPQECTADDCRQFVGRAGKGGPSGEGALDTYSVLATFSGQASGGAGAGGNEQPGVKANGTLAQYFATGFAARLLAASGSSVVNTSGQSTPAETISAEVAAKNKGQILDESKKIDRIIVSITDKGDVLDSAKRDALVNKAKFSSDGTKNTLLAFKTVQELRKYLILSFEISAKPLYDAI